MAPFGIADVMDIAARSGTLLRRVGTFRFCQDCGWNGPPFRLERCAAILIRSELDAAFAHLYGWGAEDID